MKFAALALSLLLQPLAIAVADVAAEDTAYSHIALHHVGTMKGNYQAGHMLSRMENGVDMTFVAADPEKSLHIQAETVDFVYPDGPSGVPTGLELTGNVTITIAENVIRSQRAEVDLDSGTALFTGAPQMNAEQLKNLRAKSIRVNLKTGDFEVIEGEIEVVDLDFGQDDPETAESGSEEDAE